MSQHRFENRRKSKNQEDFLKAAVYRYVHKWSPLFRKSNEKCGFIAAPTDVHFVLMCHIMARNDQFVNDQGKIFYRIVNDNRKTEA